MVPDRPAHLPQGGVRQAQVPQMFGFPLPVADFARNLSGLLVVLDCLSHLPEVSVGDAQVSQMVAFPASVTDLARDL